MHGTGGGGGRARGRRRPEPGRRRRRRPPPQILQRLQATYETLISLDFPFRSAMAGRRKLCIAEGGRAMQRIYSQGKALVKPYRVENKAVYCDTEGRVLYSAPGEGQKSCQQV